MNEKNLLDPTVPADALTILTRATANLTGTRGDHQAIMTALDTLGKAIAPPPAPAPTPEPTPPPSPIAGGE